MKQVSFLIFLLCGFAYATIAQHVLYSNSFDNPSDTLGWSHYSLNGIDDWEWGVPNATRFDSARSAPNAWVTNLNGNASSSNRTRALETPYFNLSDTTRHYSLSFHHKRHSAFATHTFRVEYKIENVVTSWQVLDYHGSLKHNWHSGSSGFSLNHPYAFQYSAINLYGIQGHDSVKFRFVHNVHAVQQPGEGWMIDDFRIEEEYFNLFAKRGDTTFVTQNCVDYTIFSKWGSTNNYNQIPQAIVNFYFSPDTVFDAQDSMLISLNVGGSPAPSFKRTFPLPSNIAPGYYYIFYEYDALHTTPESNEADNIDYAVLCIAPITPLPIIEDFDSGNDPWTVTYEGIKNTFDYWEMGQGVTHHLEGARSGTNAWHTSRARHIDYGTCGNECRTQYVETPYIDLTTDTNDLVLSLWFKDYIFSNAYTIEYSKWCTDSWQKSFFTFPPNREDEWDFVNVPLDAISSENLVRFRVKFEGSHLRPEGIIFDDFYIGPIMPDLAIERNHEIRFTQSTTGVDSLKYFLVNSGLAVAAASETAFYWSTDSVLDASDILLGVQQESAMTDTARKWTHFTYTKPTTAPGTYYILYQVDTADVVEEMREYDNSGVFTLVQTAPIAGPYFNDFETQITGWHHFPSLGQDDWQWTTPKGHQLDTAFSGTHAWITKDTGTVFPMSRMHLYTPIFDLSAMTNPTMEFDLKKYPLNKYHTGQWSGANVSYSLDGGATWTILDTTNQSFKCWYYHMEYTLYGTDRLYPNPYRTRLFNAGYADIYEEKNLVHTIDYQSRDSKNTTHFNVNMGFLAGNTSVQFRFNFATQDVPGEGILLDNFQIREPFYELSVDHHKSLMLSSQTPQVKFFMSVYNHGNYRTDSTIAEYYVSQDTVLDSNDFFLGQEIIPELRPEMSQYVNAMFNAPPGLSSYRYLIYKLDATNVHVEVNEQNNIGYWTLALDSISSYPYLQEFGDSVVHGWNNYLLTYGSKSHVKGEFRMRNKSVIGEPIHWNSTVNDEMFSEQVSRVINSDHLDVIHLESPAFDFSRYGDIQLSFDLMCSGSFAIQKRDGGNFEFSTDGGNTWAVLTEQHGQATNWYIPQPLHNLYNQPGWSGSGFGTGLRPVSIDISFLQGQKHVVFRFKHRSKATTGSGSDPQGLRVDNFLISAQIMTVLPEVKICLGDSAQILGAYRSVAGIYCDTLQTFDGKDSLICQELQVLPPSETIITARICEGESYLSPSGNYTWTTFGNHFDTLTSSIGCDSTFIVHLIVDVVDTTITQNSNSLQANAQNATFQWLDCNNGFAPMANQTFALFAPPFNGFFAVAVTQNNCTDTSACYPFIVGSLIQNDFGRDFIAYPNPTQGRVMIELGQTYHHVTLTVTNIHGQMVQSMKFGTATTIDFDLQGAKGLYILRLSTAENKSAIMKVIKE